MSCRGGKFDGQGGPALNMNGITIGADLFLRDDFEAKGPVDLTRARITGQVACTKGKFDGQGGPALDMNAITIGADLYLRDDFEAKGSVDLARGTVQGGLRMNGGRFEGGIVAEALTVRGPFLMHDLKALPARLI